MPRINSFFIDSAHLSDEAIALYVDALRSNKVYLLPSVILMHVADCGDCKKQIVEMYTLLQGSEFDSTIPHPFLDKETDKGERRFSLAFRIAAVLAIGVSIGIISYYFKVIWDVNSLSIGPNVAQQYVGKGSRDIVPRDSLMAGKQELIADNFAASPNLENLVNVHSRSLSIQVLSPLNGENLKGRILFRWKGKAETRLTLKILTNKEKTFRAITVSGSKYLLSQKIPPGLYYWKLESNDELLYLGKFLVK